MGSHRRSPQCDGAAGTRPTAHAAASRRAGRTEPGFGLERRRQHDRGGAGQRQDAGQGLGEREGFHEGSLDRCLRGHGADSSADRAHQHGLDDEPAVALVLLAAVEEARQVGERMVGGSRGRRTPECRPRGRARRRPPAAGPGTRPPGRGGRASARCAGTPPSCSAPTGRAGCARRCAPRSERRAAGTAARRRRPPKRRSAPGSCRAAGSAARADWSALEQAGVGEHQRQVARREVAEARPGRAAGCFGSARRRGRT